MESNDQLIECRRCGGNACYEQNVNETTKTWLCMGCGFTTSTLLTKDSDLVKTTLQSSPELYKDLMHEDSDGYIWFPSTITLPEKGMVFIDGTSTEDWRWASVQAVKISEEEKSKYPKDQLYKMDMTSAKYFGRRDFMDALDNINFYTF